MIQILGLRKFIDQKDGPTKGKEVTYDAFHDKNWRAHSVALLFDDLDKRINQVPTDERYNLFYTLANCGTGKRQFVSQSVLAWDLDGIDRERLNEYLIVVLDVLKLQTTDVAAVASGNGLHVIVELQRVIDSKDFFKTNRPHYGAVCTQINAALAAAGLPGKTDVMIFDARRILRLPNTINRKAGKPETQSRLLFSHLHPVDFSLERLSGLPTVKAGDTMSEKVMRRFKKTDDAAVMSGCEFLKYAKENAATLTEPEWYKVLTITSRLEDGVKISHEISEDHPTYSREATDAKIEQALAATGPYKCKSINDAWGKCTSCAYFGKVESPIMIVGAGHVATENTGFHHVITKKDGSESFKPDVDGLRQFFKRETKYRVLADTRIVYVWTGTHYEAMGDASIEGYAYDHFDPKVSVTRCQEFRKLVGVTEIVPVEWFEDTTNRKANFLNGYYDFDKKDFLPHDPDIGFRTVLPFDFDPRADAPHYRAMLDRVTSGEKATQDLLNEFGGYVVGGDRYWLHKAIVLVGEGANGKSTWLNVLKAVVGKGNYSSIGMRDLQQSEYYKQMLDHKLVNISEEMPRNSLFDTSLFKALTSGLEIPVRTIFKEPYDIRNKAKMVFTCNDLPESRDASHGFFRRLLFVPFKNKFEQGSDDYDPFIEEKLNTELPGIFNEFLNGYERLVKARRFSTCESVEKTKADYWDEVDVVGSWVRENVKFYPVDSSAGKFVFFSDLYQEWCEAMRVSGERLVTKNTFSKQLRRVVTDYDERHKVARVDKKLGIGFVACDIEEGIGLE
jgi:P4 family phage/plasmid primase-like protien